MNRDEAHQLIDNLFDMYIPADTSVGIPGDQEEAPARELPEGKRVVRTKSSGDRVYYLDEEKKTRQWVTNPEVLKGLGFEAGDVVEVEDSELLNYQMASAIYKVENDA